MTPKIWLCPLCALVEMPYGTTCKEFHEGTCVHINEIHLTGQFYLHEHQTGVSIGIAEIANEANAT